jgi:hypothetical protein
VSELPGNSIQCFFYVMGKKLVAWLPLSSREAEKCNRIFWEGGRREWMMCGYCP